MSSSPRLSLWGCRPFWGTYEECTSKILDNANNANENCDAIIKAQEHAALSYPDASAVCKNKSKEIKWGKAIQDQIKASRKIKTEIASVQHELKKADDGKLSNVQVAKYHHQVVLLLIESELQPKILGKIAYEVEESRLDATRLENFRRRQTERQAWTVGQGSHVYDIYRTTRGGSKRELSCINAYINEIWGPRGPRWKGSPPADLEEARKREHDLAVSRRNQLRGEIKEEEEYKAGLDALDKFPKAFLERRKALIEDRDQERPLFANAQAEAELEHRADKAWAQLKNSPNTKALTAKQSRTMPPSKREANDKLFVALHEQIGMSSSASPSPKNHQQRHHSPSRPEAASSRAPKTSTSTSKPPAPQTTTDLPMRPKATSSAAKLPKINNQPADSHDRGRVRHKQPSTKTAGQSRSGSRSTSHDRNATRREMSQI